MAQFRAVIQTPRGSVSRLGHKRDGLSTYTNGWDVGISVRAFHAENSGDRFEIYLTQGSNGPSGGTWLASIEERGTGAEVHLNLDAKGTFAKTMIA